MSQTKLLFTGESHYQVHEALRYRKENFVKKYGSEWMHSFRNDEIDQQTIQSCILAWWFFSQKSLTIIYGIPRDNTTTNKIAASEAEWLESLLINNRETIPEDNIVILVSYKPDKRTKSWKFFSNHATIKDFSPKKGKDLTLFVLDKCSIGVQDKRVSLISNQQAAYIVAHVGNNLYNLHHECDKVVHYCMYHKLTSIETSVLDTLLYKQAAHDSFKVLDSMFSDPNKAIALIQEAQENQQNEFEFLGMLYRWLKLILSMLDLDAQGIKGSKEIAKIVKIHPFAVAKQYGNIWLYKEHQSTIESMYTQLLQLDFHIKTGQFPPEWFWVKIKSLIHIFGK